jgi:hypothetical protein
MRVLQRAVELLGSERALARALRVPMPELFGWLKGSERPTRAIFLAAVDVLIERGDPSPSSGDATMAPLQSNARPGNFLRADDEKKG